MRSKKLLAATIITILTSALVACGNTADAKETTTQSQSATKTVTQNSDGSKTLVRDDGSTATVKEDGTTIIKDKDGKETTVNADGSAVIKNTDGTTTNVDKDGKATTTNSSGEVVSVEEHFEVAKPADIVEEITKTEEQKVISNDVDKPSSNNDNNNSNTNVNTNSNSNTNTDNKPTQTQAATQAQTQAKRCTHTQEYVNGVGYQKYDVKEVEVYEPFPGGAIKREHTFYAIFDYATSSKFADCPTYLFVNRQEVPDITQTEWYQDGGQIIDTIGNAYYPEVMYLDCMDTSKNALNNAYHDYTYDVMLKFQRDEIPEKELLGMSYLYCYNTCVDYTEYAPKKTVTQETPLNLYAEHHYCSKCGEEYWMTYEANGRPTRDDGFVLTDEWRNLAIR